MPTSRASRSPTDRANGAMSVGEATRRRRHARRWFVEASPPGSYGRRRSARPGRANQRRWLSTSVAPTQTGGSGEHGDADHAENTRCSSGSRITRPAHTQHRTTRTTAASVSDLPGGGAVRLAAIARPTCRPTPCRTGRTTRTAGRSARRPAWRRRPCDPACPGCGPRSGPRGGGRDRCRRLVGDQQRLAGGVGRGVGEAGLEHGERSSKSVDDEPLAMGGVEGRPHLGPETAGRPRTAPGGSNVPCDAGEDADLLDQPGPGVLGAGSAGGRRIRYDRDGNSGGERADGHRRGDRCRRCTKTVADADDEHGRHDGDELAAAGRLPARPGHQPSFGRGARRGRRPGRAGPSGPTPLQPQCRRRVHEAMPSARSAPASRAVIAHRSRGPEVSAVRERLEGAAHGRAPTLVGRTRPLERPAGPDRQRCRSTAADRGPAGGGTGR